VNNVEQMRHYLIQHYGYALDTIPIGLGGTFDPAQNAVIRCQVCSTKVIQSQSICRPYYAVEQQAISTKNASQIVFVNGESHDESNVLTSKLKSSSLLAVVTLKHPSNAQHRVHKRGSSSSVNLDKRHRSNESLIEEESPTSNHSNLPKQAAAVE
jgi:hypothetical protein